MKIKPGTDDPPDPPDPPEDPPPPEPLEAQPPPPAGETRSITSWTRIETRCGDERMERTPKAQIYDPLWMLTRQWQVGEFQGEDAGSPVVARTRAQTAMLSRCHLGPIAVSPQSQATAYDSERLPLEVLVERQRVRSTTVTQVKRLRLTVDAGLHFFRLLEQQSLSKNYRAAFIARYPLSLPTAADLAALDATTQGFLLTMAGRAVDARLLEAAFRPSADVIAPLDVALQIASVDMGKVQQAGTQWLAWYDSLFSEPDAGANDAWTSERMEYALCVAGRLTAQPSDEKTLTATQLYEGGLDWSDFDLDPKVSLGTQGDQKFKTLAQTTVPAPVSFRGTPATRYWEFEDARVEYGLLSAGPADLAQLMMVEYTSSYGNDWFVIPLELPVGSITAINSLVVTDTFGVRTLLRPLGDPALAPAHWSMFQHSLMRRAESDVNGIAPNLFFLAPALGGSLQSTPVEEVLFMRDEMANVAWGIERCIEGPLELALNRGDTLSLDPATYAPDTVPPQALPRYLLSTQVPAHWIPLLPVQLSGPGGSTLQRLKRGAVLRPDGTQQISVALGSILNPGGPLLLNDEEVPRAGARVTRHYQLARWLDGATFAWLANRKQVGKGEGSSALRFDSIDSAASWNTQENPVSQSDSARES